MSPDNKKHHNIEIIPPNPSHRREQPDDWVHISFDDNARAFSTLPLHKRILYVLTSLLGLLLVGVIVFLVFASVVLIWIPLIIATIMVLGGIAFLRARLSRR